MGNIRRSQVNKIPRKCRFCKKAFLAWPHEIRNGHGIYCSNSCFHKMPGKVRKERISNAVSCTCLNCGNKFHTKPSEVRDGGGKYCSRDCYYNGTKITLGRKLIIWTKITKRGCIEWTANKNEAGYGLVNVRINGVRKMVLVHRVTYELVNGPIPKGMLICHHCDNPSCCNPHHLFMGKMKDNMDDKVEKGRHVKGEQSHYARLTAEQVLEIRSKKKSGHSLTQLSAEYKTSVGNICAIIARRSWKHI